MEIYHSEGLPGLGLFLHMLPVSAKATSAIKMNVAPDIFYSCVGNRNSITFNYLQSDVDVHIIYPPMNDLLLEGLVTGTELQ